MHLYKKTALAFLTCFTLMAFSLNVKPADDLLKKHILSTVDNWQELSHSTILDYEVIKSWVPERGVRGRYAIAKYLAKSILEQIIGVKVYKSGPHTNNINLSSSNDFGKYNPKFLRKINKRLSKLYKKKKFVKNTQALYDQEFKNYLRVYYLSYQHIQSIDHKAISNKYQEIIRNTKDNNDKHDFLAEPSYYLQESFRSFSDKLENDGYDPYETLT